LIHFNRHHPPVPPILHLVQIGKNPDDTISKKKSKAKLVDDKGPENAETQSIGKVVSLNSPGSNADGK
jgi:hypothetical protein